MGKANSLHTHSVGQHQSTSDDNLALASGSAHEGLPPLHRRITAILMEQIERGRLPPGSVLPPELELARQFGVSRHTMRAGLDALVRAGLIERQRGKGTVVVRSRIQQSLARFYSIAREMHSQGVPLVTRVLERGRFMPGDPLEALACQRLGIHTPSEIGYLWRLRLTEGEPLILEWVTFPAALCPALLVPPADGASDLATRSFYEVLAECANISVTQARETFRPEVATGHTARLLTVPAGTPIFLVERTGYAAERPVEWRRSLVRGDRMTYGVDLLNPAEEGEYPVTQSQRSIGSGDVSQPTRFDVPQQETISGEGARS